MNMRTIVNDCIWEIIGEEYIAKRAKDWALGYSNTNWKKRWQGPININSLTSSWKVILHPRHQRQQTYLARRTSEDVDQSSLVTTLAAWFWIIWRDLLSSMVQPLQKDIMEDTLLRKIPLAIMFLFLKEDTLQIIFRAANLVVGECIISSLLRYETQT